MQFRYDFVGDKLDLSHFQTQAKRHIAKMRRLTYYFYVLGYKIQVNIDTPDDCTAHMVDFAIMELQRDNDGEIQLYDIIRVHEDLRFKEISDVVKYYESNSEEGHFESASVDKTVAILSNLIKVIYKINNLKAFL
jgi:hypothetical protein